MKEFWKANSDKILLGALFLYTLILAIGTIGVAFDIEWILRFF